MSEKNFSYYQFQKKMNYQVYLRFEDFEFENYFTEVLEMMGFDKVERDNVKDIKFVPGKTKVLKITKASPRVARQIVKSDFLFDKFGKESLSKMGTYDVYRYRGFAMMIFSQQNALWELGVKDFSDQDTLRVIFTRFLSYALAPSGVIGFWGVPVDEGFVVMSQNSANFETVFVDLNQSVLLTYDGIKPIESELQILRLDSTLNREVKEMKKEELISFLSMNTNFLSYQGLDQGLKKVLFDLCKVSKAFIYPEENFKPRAELDETTETDSKLKAA